MLPPLAATSAQVPGGSGELLRMGTAGAAAGEGEEMCHTVRGGSGRDGGPLQRGDQSRTNSKLQGWGAESPGSLKGRRRGSWEHARKGNLSWEDTAPLCQVAWEAHLP